MKSVLISIQPKWVEKIASDKKTIEVRKSRPKIETPFKCYIYETKGKQVEHCDGCDVTYYGRGKVIGEFICDHIYEIDCAQDFRSNRWLLKESCLKTKDIEEYLAPKWFGYAWHISDLKIYDKSKELSEFYKPFKYDGDGLICGTKQEINDIYEWDCETVFGKKYPNFDFENCKCEDCPKAKDFYCLTRPPQSWCYVENLGE